MTKEPIIKGEKVPIMTLTRRELEEDWYTLHTKLKQKEQECEELRDELEWVHGIKDKLNKENEQLKKSVRSNKDKRKRAIERYIRLKEFTDKNFNQFEIDMEKAENKRYKQALQEIKEIADKYQKEYLVNNGVFLLCNQILQKCEVLDEK